MTRCDDDCWPRAEGAWISWRFTRVPVSLCSDEATEESGGVFARFTLGERAAIFRLFFFSLFPSVFPPVLVGRGRSIFTFPLPAYRFLPQSAFLAASDSGRNPLQPFFAGLICDQSMRGGERRRRRRSSAKSVEICVHADEWGKYATKKKTTEYRLITYNVLYCS